LKLELSIIFFLLFGTLFAYYCINERITFHQFFPKNPKNSMKNKYSFHIKPRSFISHQIGENKDEYQEALAYFNGTFTI